MIRCSSSSKSSSSLVQGLVIDGWDDSAVEGSRHLPLHNPLAGQVKLVSHCGTLSFMLKRLHWRIQQLIERYANELRLSEDERQAVRAVLKEAISRQPVK